MVSLQCQLSPFHLSPAVKSNVLGDLVSQFSQKCCVKDKIRLALPTGLLKKKSNI